MSATKNLPARPRRRRVFDMRGSAIALSMVFLPWACAPKVPPPNGPFDEDLPQHVPAPEATDQPVAQAATPEPLPPEPVAPRPIAPPGKGLRSGTIARDRLVAILDAGAGSFLRQFELAPKLSGERFVGWELIQLIDRLSPLADLDLVPGDVLLAVNGKPISRPDQLQTLWDSLRTANEVSAQLWRGDTQLTLVFAIEPKI